MVLTLILRNLKLFFRDKAAVFFSLISIFITIGLFMLFLAQIHVDGIMRMVLNIDEAKVKYFVHSWILAGLLSISTVTAVFGGFGTLIEDRVKKISMAFASAPIKNWVYPVANVLSAVIIGVMISTLTLIVYSISVNVISGYALPMETLLLAFLMVVVSALINAFIAGAICALLRSQGAYTGLSTLIGTCIGFINGVYISVASLNETIANILPVFPSLHLASVFRSLITKPGIDQIFEYVPGGANDTFLESYGITLKVGDVIISPQLSLLYAGIIGVLALGFMIFIVRKKKREI